MIEHATCRFCGLPITHGGTPMLATVPQYRDAIHYERN